MCAVPTENVATVAACASVVEGVSRSRNALLNGDTRNYDWDSGYTCHQLGSGAIVIQLAQPFAISSLRYVRHFLTREPTVETLLSVGFFLALQAFSTTPGCQRRLTVLRRVSVWFVPCGPLELLSSTCDGLFLLRPGCCCGTATNAPTVITSKCRPISSSGPRWLTAPGWPAGGVPVLPQLWRIQGLKRRKADQLETAY